MTTLIISIVFLFLGFGLMVWARIEFDKCAKMLLDCKDIMARHKENAESDKKTIERLTKRITELDKQVDVVMEGYSALQDAAYNYHIFKYAITEENNAWYLVCKRVNVKDRQFTIAIKRFFFNPNDPEDKDYARREAEELLDKLNEKQ